MSEFEFGWATEAEIEALKKHPPDLFIKNYTANGLKDNLFVARENGEIAGFVLFEANYLARAFIYEKFRGGAGLASNLYKKSIHSRFRQNPQLKRITTRVWADVPRHQKALLKMVNLMGFQTETEIDFFIEREKAMQWGAPKPRTDPRPSAPAPRKPRVRR